MTVVRPVIGVRIVKVGEILAVVYTYTGLYRSSGRWSVGGLPAHRWLRHNARSRGLSRVSGQSWPASITVECAIGSTVRCPYRWLPAHRWLSDLRLWGSARSACWIPAHTVTYAGLSAHRGLSDLWLSELWL